jgi:hypothetical protein
MSGPPTEVTQAKLAIGAATDGNTSQIAARDAAHGSVIHEDFLAIVRALAKRHAREDYAAEIAASTASQTASKVEP